jgi:hypothetical protein
MFHEPILRSAQDFLLPRKLALNEVKWGVLSEGEGRGWVHFAFKNSV